MAAKQSKVTKEAHPFTDAFFVHRRYVGLYDDLECEDIDTGGKKFFIVYRKATFIAPRAANSERAVPVRPARIVVEETGKASLQVLFRVFQETSTEEEFCELLKQLSAVGGYRLCSGLDVRDVSQSRASTVMHFTNPFERMEARGCLLWFSPKYRRKPLVNNLMSRCPRCSVWTSHTKYQKKRSREETDEDQVGGRENNVNVLTQLVEEVVAEAETQDNGDEKERDDEHQTQSRAEESIVTTTLENIKTVPTSIFKSRQETNPSLPNVTVSIQSVRDVVLTDGDGSVETESNKRQKLIEIQLVEDAITPQADDENVDRSVVNGSVPSTIGWAIASDISSMISWNTNRTRITMESQDKESSLTPE